ncbi:replication initiator protein A [Gluconacetobacter azotocaptans]|uniref:replication initiator protein A n=1 Tax=Gluconacetobacter azotocaptans TaxID=142834 RepID=UPI00195C89C1|nr:replication initiator protein A [Gluconacetobacter azotocaptans]MBM9400802.1 replication initiator protein A [Gluconacetobacter azotocaptans]
MPRIFMSNAFFALGKGRRRAPLRFRQGSQNILVSSPMGLATIWDADILIWATSTMIAAQRCGAPIPTVLQATRYEILGFPGRDVSGGYYERLPDGLERLSRTNVVISASEWTDEQTGAPWIEDWRISDGFVQIRLAAWLREAVLTPRAVLALDPAYFTLTSGLERLLYLIARRHAGRQKDGWIFEVTHLYRKTGTTQPLTAFVAFLRRLIQSGGLPGYRLELSDRNWPERVRIRPVADVPVDNAVDNLVDDFGKTRLSPRGSTPIALENHRQGIVRQ